MRISLLVKLAYVISKPIPDIDLNTASATRCGVGDFYCPGTLHWLVGVQDLSWPHQHGWARHHRFRRVLENRTAGSKSDVDGIAEEPEPVDEAANGICVLPIISAVERLTGEATGEIRCAPTADPAVPFVDETDALQVRVTLWVIDLFAYPSDAAVDRLENGSRIEVLQRNETDRVVQELDFPTPLSEGELLLEVRNAINPRLTAVFGV